MIRKATMEDYDTCYHLAELFAGSTKATGIDYEVFKKTWKGLVDTGVIFRLEKDNEIAGDLEAITYQCVFDRMFKGGEVFWFVHPDKRGGGIQLLEAFEKWAEEQGCKRREVCYLTDSMPEVVKKVFENRGYVESEVHYMKEI